MKYFTMVHWKLHNVERSWEHRQTCSSFRCRNHLMKQTFYAVFHALKTLGEITTWSNAITTFPLTLVDQILAQENLSDHQQLTWINCKKKKKMFPWILLFPIQQNVPHLQEKWSSEVGYPLHSREGKFPFP